MAVRHAALLAALAAIWGGSYLLIKYGLEDLEPGVIVWARTALAAVVLLSVLLLTRGGADARTALADLRARPATAALLGGVSVALPFLLITFGELEVPSGLTAVLVAPASLFVAALAPFLDVTERVSRRAVGGMVLGLAGVALLVGIESVHSAAEFAGALAILGSALCYALGTFVVKRSYAGMPAPATSFISMVAASLLVLPVAVVSAPTGVPGVRAILSVAALGVVGTALAFVIYYQLIADVGAGRASLVSYLAPGVALFYGAAFYDEPITPAAVAGLALILGGVALASRSPGAALSRAGSGRRPGASRPRR